MKRVVGAAAPRDVHFVSDGNTERYAKQQASLPSHISGGWKNYTAQHKR
jgi:hypothetical protein